MANTKKTVLITGCSSGIGHALAREFTARGCQVYATARRTEMIADLSDMGVHTLQLDVDDPSSIAALKNSVDSLTGGKLDILVNNAGRNYTVPASDLDFDEVEQTFRTNVFGVMRLCKAFTPLLISSGGTIVQIGSIAALTPYVFGSVYNATKAALHAYSNTLRVELAPFNVKVVTIITGGVKSMIARTDRTLEEGSIYLPVKDEYLRRTKHSQEVGIPSEDYAKTVVAQVLKESPRPHIWAGSNVLQVWFATTFLPIRFLDGYITRLFGLWKLSRSETKKSI